MRLTNRMLAVGAVLGLALAAAACDSDPETDEPPPDPTGPAAPPPDDGEAVTLSVTSPTAGETVTVPFDVVVDTSVVVGPIDVEDHHLHIWFDDPGGAPNIVTSTTATIDGTDIAVPDGATTMIVQIHTNDHQPVGDPVEVPLTVVGGTGGEDDDDRTDPYDRDY